MALALIAFALVQAMFGHAASLQGTLLKLRGEL